VGGEGRVENRLIIVKHCFRELVAERGYEARSKRNTFLIWICGQKTIEFITFGWMEDHIVRIESDCRRGLNFRRDLLTSYTHDSLSTSNYSATGNLHNLQITTAPDKQFPACCVFTRLSLRTASNTGEFSASLAHPIHCWPPSHNWTWSSLLPCL
jgi:hypothetical protein